MDGLTGTKAGSGVWQRIISEMPAHEVYIEPFWGRGTIAKRKRPARYTIGVDLDPAAIASGQGVALMFQADGLQWLADYFRPAAAAAESGGKRSPAAKLLAPPNSATVDAHHQTPKTAAPPANPCTFGGCPWEKHFVYIDPPYLGFSGYYRHELTEHQHQVLCRLFLQLPCPAALSGYQSDVYAAELSGARSIEIPTVNRAGQSVREILWMNYDPPARYHDTRYHGACRRERERIRRRQKAWANGLRKMPTAERQAIFEACAAAYHDARADD